MEGSSWVFYKVFGEWECNDSHHLEAVNSEFDSHASEVGNDDWNSHSGIPLTF